MLLLPLFVAQLLVRSSGVSLMYPFHASEPCYNCSMGTEMSCSHVREPRSLTVGGWYRLAIQVAFFEDDETK